MSPSCGPPSVTPPLELPLVLVPPLVLPLVLVPELDAPESGSTAGVSSLPQPVNTNMFASAAAATIEMTPQGSFLIVSPPASASVDSSKVRRARPRNPHDAVFPGWGTNSKRGAAQFCGSGAHERSA